MAETRVAFVRCAEGLANDLSFEMNGTATHCGTALKHGFNNHGNIFFKSDVTTFYEIFLKVM